jgi:hypothetical protein
MNGDDAVAATYSTVYALKLHWEGNSRIILRREIRP